jgi:trans-aconitate 2-methyltransferase
MGFLTENYGQDRAPGHFAGLGGCPILKRCTERRPGRGGQESILDSWNPAQYHRFADARQRPAADLLVRVPLAAPKAIYDLGCGSGKSTVLLRERWPGASITGIDSSPAMLAAARRELPALGFVEGDIATWSPPQPADLIFSNAALHWLDSHRTLFARLFVNVAAGGWLAIQMPRNHDQPSHQAMVAAAEAGPWRDRLRPHLRPSPVGTPESYHTPLAPLAVEIDIWETTYLHVLTGRDPVLEWTKGTALKPLLDALESPWREAFEADYRARVAKAYPPEVDGRTLFPFKRLFILAKRAS